MLHCKNTARTSRAEKTHLNLVNILSCTFSRLGSFSKATPHLPLEHTQVIYAGHDSKALLNNTGSRAKRSKLERAMNSEVLGVVLNSRRGVSKFLISFKKYLLY
jgi:hypothetical protein